MRWRRLNGSGPVWIALLNAIRCLDSFVECNQLNAIRSGLRGGWGGGGGSLGVVAGGDWTGL